MPVLWTVFHSAQIVIISVTGVVGLEDMVECVEGIMTPATLSYRKLVDLTEGRAMLSPKDNIAFAEFMRECTGKGPMAALAIATGSHEGAQKGRLFVSPPEADRPLKIFRELQGARSWLDAQPIRALGLWA